jgi:hypothetical protein
MSRCYRRVVSQVPVLATGYEGPYFFTAKLMPLQAQSRFGLADDLGLYQSRGM